MRAATRDVMQQLINQGWADIEGQMRKEERAGWIKVTERNEEDPRGVRMKEMLDELIEEVEEGKDIRLMCHCRDTREGTEGSMTCHLEPVAEYIEVMAKAVRERKGYGRTEEAQGSKEKERRAGDGEEREEEGRAQSWPAKRAAS